MTKTLELQIAGLMVLVHDDIDDCVHVLVPRTAPPVSGAVAAGADEAHAGHGHDTRILGPGSTWRSIRDHRWDLRAVGGSGGSAPGLPAEVLPVHLLRNDCARQPIRRPQLPKPGAASPFVSHVLLRGGRLETECVAKLRVACRNQTSEIATVLRWTVELAVSALPEPTSLGAAAADPAEFADLLTVDDAQVRRAIITTLPGDFPGSVDGIGVPTGMDFPQHLHAFDGVWGAGKLERPEYLGGERRVLAAMKSALAYPRICPGTQTELVD